MTKAAANSMTKKAEPTDAPTTIAVVSKLLCTSATTGVHAASEVLPDEGVVCSWGQGVQEDDAFEVE